MPEASAAPHRRPFPAGLRTVLTGLRLGLLAALAAAVLAACGGGPGASLPDEVVASARHANGGPTEITLLTVVHNRTGAGDHSALLIAGEERVIYDPAGTFRLEVAPRRGDVIHGVSPDVEVIYLGYHARETHHVVAQTLPLTAAQARAAQATAAGFRPAPAGFCAIRTGAVLRSIPGLEGLSTSPWPRRLSERFGALPDVTETRIDLDDIPLSARPRGPESLAAPAG